MQLLIIILTLATITTPTRITCWDHGEEVTATPSLCDQEFAKAYKLATEWIYPDKAYIGEILNVEEHNCDSWLPVYWNPGKVAVRPLYSDSGLPLYDIFEDEWEELVGFEFRSWVYIAKTCKLVNRSKGFDTWCCWEDEREIVRGYSIVLTDREKFLYAILE